MKKLSFIVFVVCLLFSCSNDENSQEEDSQKLEKMYNEIIAVSLANSEPCTNRENWSFTALSASNCDKHPPFIVYSKKINKENFLAKVKKYQDAKSAYDGKWGPVTMCLATAVPTGVDCVDEKPILTYN